ncbi:MAG: DUF4869 domain-containing protein [Lachnospiraceae bacterium]|nr:DUF4869 domain-containing protein [Lachnospiraceae bacterium]MBR1523816.1 DUF4869 domain-containing protein [Lachnospiraceae bacterium]
MLNIYFGSTENEIFNPSVYFDNRHEPEWLINALSKEMIHDIDKSEVVGPNLIQSPVLGPISPERLSGGVKALMLMAFDESEKIFNASACGDNCAKWILKIAESKELTVTLHNIMSFKDLPFKAKILNNGKMLDSYNDYIFAADEALHDNGKAI